LDFFRHNIIVDYFENKRMRIFVFSGFILSQNPHFFKKNTLLTGNQKKQPPGDWFSWFSLRLFVG